MVAIVAPRARSRARAAARAHKSQVQTVVSTTSVAVNLYGERRASAAGEAIGPEPERAAREASARAAGGRRERRAAWEARCATCAPHPLSLLEGMKYVISIASNPSP